MAPLFGIVISTLYLQGYWGYFSISPFYYLTLQDVFLFAALPAVWLFSALAALTALLQIYIVTPFRPVKWITELPYKLLYLLLARAGRATPEVISRFGYILGFIEGFWPSVLSILLFGYGVRHLSPIWIKLSFLVALMNLLFGLHRLCEMQDAEVRSAGRLARGNDNQAAMQRVVYVIFLFILHILFAPYFLGRVEAFSVVAPGSASRATVYHSDKSEQGKFLGVLGDNVFFLNGTNNVSVVPRGKVHRIVFATPVREGWRWRRSIWK